MDLRVNCSPRAVASFNRKKNKTGTQRPLLAEKRLEDCANLTGVLTKSLKSAWCIVNNKQIDTAAVKVGNIIHS